MTPTPEQLLAWQMRLGDYYDGFGIEPVTAVVPARAPFDDAKCALIEALQPAVISFHFGLPVQTLLHRVKAAGCVVLSSATTVAEALWLEAHGCDVIIAQGYEAGGHRGMFLHDELATQVGTMALVPQIVDAVSIPVVAAGGIADGRGIAAAFALGAAAVQIGTAYLLTPEASITPMHRTALIDSSAHQTALTNVFSGKPARSIVNRLVREVGPTSDRVPPFPAAAGALAPLKARAEAERTFPRSGLVRRSVSSKNPRQWR